MPTSRQYIESCNLVISRAWGKLTDAELFEHVKALNDLTLKIDTVVELGDIRFLEPTKALTVKGITQAAGHEIVRPNSRLSLLYPPDDSLLFGLGRAYEMFSEWQRGSVGMHDDIEIALDWLGIDSSDFELVKKYLTPFV